MSMTTRKIALLLFLGLVLGLTGILATDWTSWWLAPIHHLGRYQTFHVAAHFSIFASVVMLYGQPKRSALPLVALVLAGSVGVEVIQVVLSGIMPTRHMLLDSLFDLTVDWAGASMGWAALAVARQQISLRRAGGTSGAVSRS